MGAKFHFKKIRSWLTLWLLALALLPVTVFSIVIYIDQVESIHEEGIAKLTAIRNNKANDLTLWLAERTGDLGVIAGDLEIQRILATNDKQQPSDQGLRYQQIARNLLQRYIDNYDQYRELFIVDAKTGKVILSTDIDSEGASKKNDPYFTGPLQSAALFIKDIYFSETLQAATMAFSMPIFTPDDKSQITAVLVARVDLQNSIYKLLLDRTGLGETGETLIVNRDGLALNELRWSANAPLNLKINATPALLASQGQQGVIEIDDYRGKKVLAAYSHIPRVGWGFVAKQDVTEVYAPVQALLFHLLLIFALTAGTAILCAFYLAGRIVTPIVAMKEVASRLQEGDLTVRNTTNRDDELGFLARSINAMIDSIQSRIKIRKQSADIIETLVTAQDLPSFSQVLLNKLMIATNSCMAAIYIRDEEDRTFKVFDSLGAEPDSLPRFDAEKMEGELGLALASGEIEHITRIPADTRFVFKAVAGQALPREIITIPLADQNQVNALVSLAGLKEYSDESLEILQVCWKPMSSALARVLARENVLRMANELAVKNEELTAANEELQVNTEELQVQSEELREQTEELRQTATELEVQRVQVEEADRLKSEFLSNMSHELRTPLNSVLALSQLMISRGTGKNPEEEQMYLEVIERNGRQLLNLINDILDLAKIESGRMDILSSGFDSREIVRRAIDTIAPLAEEKGLTLQIETAAVPEMASDAEKLNQILLNLLSNAVKFTEQGEITIKVTATEQTASFMISDTGIGISPEDLPHIFDKFRQVDGTATRRHEGTGLGLAIGQKLATLLGGHISVESVEGKGSTFCLELPLRIPQSSKLTERMPAWLEANRTTAPARPSAQPAAGSGNPHILVVEDNKTAALQVRSVLEDNGFTVEVADCGEEALATVKRRVPDGVVLDLMMPDIDGFQVLETIRSTPATETLPVLVLSAKELTLQERSRLKNNNIKQLIRKGSVDRAQLVTAVRLMVEPAAAAPMPTAEQPKPTRSGSRTVLVVEDNPDNQLAVVATLKDLDCEVVVATTGDQALELAAKIHPGLVFMDIHLPKLGGFEATRRFKSDPALTGVPIVALTASAMKGDREKMLAAGCDDYLSKPFDPVELQEMTMKWLGISQGRGES